MVPIKVNSALASFAVASRRLQRCCISESFDMPEVFASIDNALAEAKLYNDGAHSTTDCQKCLVPLWVSLPHARAAHSVLSSLQLHKQDCERLNQDIHYANVANLAAFQSGLKSHDMFLRHRRIHEKRNSACHNFKPRASSSPPPLDRERLGAEYVKSPTGSKVVEPIDVAHFSSTAASTASCVSICDCPVDQASDVSQVCAEVPLCSTLELGIGSTRCTVLEDFLHSLSLFRLTSVLVHSQSQAKFFHIGDDLDISECAQSPAAGSITIAHKQAQTSVMCDAMNEAGIATVPDDPFILHTWSVFHSVLAAARASRLKRLSIQHLVATKRVWLSHALAFFSWASLSRTSTPVAPEYYLPPIDEVEAFAQRCLSSPWPPTHIQWHDLDCVRRSKLQEMHRLFKDPMLPSSFGVHCSTRVSISFVQLFFCRECWEWQAAQIAFACCDCKQLWCTKCYTDFELACINRPA